MKLALISGLLLLSIIVAGAFTDASVSKLCVNTKNDMEALISKAMEENFEDSATLLDKNIKIWQDKRVFLSVLQHHDFYDNLYSALLRAKQYAVFRNGALLAGEAASIVGMLYDIQSFDSFSIENIF